MRAVLKIFYFPFLVKIGGINESFRIFIFNASRIQLLNCSKLVINPKMTITPRIADTTLSSIFFDVDVFLLSSLVIQPSFMSISLLVLELLQFFIRDFCRNMKIEIIPVWDLSSVWRLCEVRDMNVSNKMYLMLQNTRFAGCNVSE